MHTCTPPGLWMRLARDILCRNNLDGRFQKSIFEALERGREKKQNLFLLGETNAAKSFLIKPLLSIFHCYTVPDTGSYQLETILDKELVYLNDFTWDETWMKWAYLKRFLEGECITVVRAKNRGGNVEFDKKIPIVGSLYAPIQLFVRAGGKNHFTLHGSETSQMNSRMQYMGMSTTLEEDEVVPCSPCEACGAALYLEGEVGRSSSSSQRPRSRSPTSEQASAASR